MPLKKETKLNLSEDSFVSGALNTPTTPPAQGNVLLLFVAITDGLVA